MAERNLDAYYYSFDATGCDLVDAVLEQVARAGKAFHCTSDWNEDDSGGESPVAKMQAAANASAQAILVLIAENKRLRNEASTAVAQRDHAEMCGDDFVRMNSRLEAERDQLREELALAKQSPLYSTRLAAERYRYLRACHWNDSPLAVVRHPKQQVKLGADCPSGDLLDAAIDAAMGKGGQSHD